MVRDYPKIKINKTPTVDDLKDMSAVSMAISETLHLPQGEDRIKFLYLVYWNGNNTRIKDAVPLLFISERTAERWHSDFIRAVGKNRGFEIEKRKDNDDKRGTCLPN